MFGTVLFVLAGVLFAACVVFFVILIFLDRNEDPGPIPKNPMARRIWFQVYHEGVNPKYTANWKKIDKILEEKGKDDESNS